MKSNWQPIRTAPKNQYVLVYCPDAEESLRVLIAGLLEFEGDPDGPDWYEQNPDTRPDPLDVEPTHWMTLPDHPGAGE